MAAADLVVALYNPRSTKRLRQLEETVEIFREVRPGSTPVGIATSAGRGEQFAVVTDLDHLLGEGSQYGRRTVIIGNNDTRLIDGWMVNAGGGYRL